MLKDFKKNNLFHFNKLIIETNSKVYDPSEDSFMLLEYLQFKPGKKILEIGTGCGLIALESARCGANVVCSDINPHSINLTKKNITKNKKLLSGTIEVREGYLFSVVKKGELFDMIIFNPPYLPTTKNDKIDRWFDLATDGGKSGLKVIKRFIFDVKKYLTPKGHAYFIFSNLSDRVKLENYLKENFFSYKIVFSRTFNDETLDIYCII